MPAVSIIPNNDENPQADYLTFFTNGGTFLELEQALRIPKGTAEGSAVVALKLRYPNGAVSWTRTTQALYLAAADAFKGARQRDDAKAPSPKPNVITDPRLAMVAELADNMIADFRKLAPFVNGIGTAADIYQQALDAILGPAPPPTPSPEQTVGDNQCSLVRKAAGMSYPSNCVLCGFGTCINKNPDEGKK